MLNSKKLFTKILGALTPQAQTITLLGFFKNLNGGVYKFGRLCVVNIAVYVDGTFNANDYYTMSTDLPPASVTSALTLTTANNAGSRRGVASVSNTGTLVVQSGDLELSHYTLYITGVYVLA